jgi:hypothetical protein
MLTGAVEPNTMLVPAPAVASVPWIAITPDSTAVEFVPATPMVRNTSSACRYHGMLVITGRIWAGPAPSATPPVPYFGVISSEQVFTLIVMMPPARTQ